MKFMLMMNAPRGTSGEWNVMTWKPDELKAHIEFMKGFARELASNGELVMAEGLADPGAAKLVRAKADGGYATDGPFAETKEFLAGFWIVDVDTRERACEIAAAASLAPGPGGRPMYLPIELREVMAGPPPT
jgi:hypothetical protein